MAWHDKLGLGIFLGQCSVIGLCLVDIFWWLWR